MNVELKEWKWEMGVGLKVILKLVQNPYLFPAKTQSKRKVRE